MGLDGTVPKEITFMNTTTAIFITFAVVILLTLFFFSGGMTSGAMFGDGMMASGHMSGSSWMWGPTALVLGLSALLAWAIFGRK